ncbi:MAG: hypothetical protein ABH814_02095, partial [bacterium]
EQYNNAGWSNYQIPTLILIPAQAFVEDPSYVRGIIQNMANQGLVPYIRVSGQLTEGENGQWVWQPIDAETAYTAGQVLNSIFSEFTGQFDGEQRVFVYNEPNLATEMGNLSFDERVNLFAETTAAFIEGMESEGVRNIKLYFPPMALQSGSEQQFIQQALALLQEHFGQNKFDGAALTLYGSDTQALQSLFNTVTNYFPGQFDFFISEIGPLVNGQLMLNTSQAQDFANFLTQVFQLKLSDPNFLPGVSGITTSFFVDTDGDGDPDETWLVVIDKDGNVIVLKILSGENPYLGSGRAGTCPNLDYGHILSCGQTFVLKLPSVFIEFVGDIAQLIYPEIDNMPSWLRGGGKYERENPITRLHPPQGSDAEERAFMENINESAWHDERMGYRWCTETGECGIARGNPELPEISNNAFRYAEESASYLWGLMQSPTQGGSAYNKGVDYPVTLTQAENNEECGIFVEDIASTANSVSFTVRTTGAVNQFKDLWYEVSGPKGKTNCSNVLPKAGNTNPKVICDNLTYEDGSALSTGDIVSIVATSPQSWEECPNTMATEQVALGQGKPGGGGGESGLNCAVYGVTGAPQTQPCVAGSCLLPEGLASRVFQEIFNKFGELVEKIPIGWLLETKEVTFMPLPQYPRTSLIGLFESGTPLYNSLLPPNKANPTPYPAISEDNTHKIRLGPFQITNLFQSDHVIPAVGRVELQREDFKKFLEPPIQKL